MPPEIWIPLAIQGVGVAAMAGMHWQTTRDLVRRVLHLERHAVTTSVHEVEVRRLDGRINEVAHRVDRVEGA